MYYKKNDQSAPSPLFLGRIPSSVHNLLVGGIIQSKNGENETYFTYYLVH